MRGKEFRKWRFNCLPRVTLGKPEDKESIYVSLGGQNLSKIPKEKDVLGKEHSMMKTTC